MATRLLLNGAEFQLNLFNAVDNGIAGNQQSPDAIAITDGRFVVGYQSSYLGSSDLDPVIRILGGTDYLNTYAHGLLQNDPALTPRSDGGFGIVFTNALHADTTNDANGPNITYVPITAAGAV